MIAVKRIRKRRHTSAMPGVPRIAPGRKRAHHHRCQQATAISAIRPLGLRRVVIDFTREARVCACGTREVGNWIEGGAMIWTATKFWCRLRR